MAHAAEPRASTERDQGGPDDAPLEPPRAVVEGTRWSLVDIKHTVLDAPTREDVQQRLDGGVFFWLDIHQPEPDDIEALRELFAFHPLALEDSTNFGQRPKIDTYDDFAFLVVYGAAGSGDDDGLVEVHC